MQLPDGRPWAVAHRGFSGEYPENTETAFIAAAPYADVIELDVRTTSDGQVIVMHDATLRRTTDVADVLPDRADDQVATFSSTEIALLDAGSWHDADHRGLRVPTLERALDLITSLGCGVLIELKVDSCDLVAAVVAEHLRRKPAAAVIAGSVDVERARRMSALLPQVPIAVLFRDEKTITADDLTDYAKFASLLGFRNDRISPALVERVHDVGLSCLHNTNTRAWMDECAASGADGTMTDYPDRKRQSIDRTAVSLVEAESGTHLVAERIDNTGLHFKLSGAEALCLSGQPDDHLVLPFRTASAEAAVECVLVRRPGGAVVDLSVDDQLRARGYNTAGPSPSRQTVRLGTVGRPGPHELRIVIVDDEGGDATPRVDSTVIIDVLVVRDR